ncbi:MAG: hypothetical protein KF914_02620 [Rhizobiaceae bacterium]|nr:hypothetical protein [Rhizobiaceae bacterium]
MGQAEANEGPVRSALMTRVFVGLSVLALLSFALFAAGQWFGSEIALAGYTDDPTPREVVIGNNVIVAPSNMIRFERARRDGIAQRLDLYLRWPQMDGYSQAASPEFNNLEGTRSIIFVGFEQRMMSRDMSGRFAPIYEALISKPGTPGPSGLTLYDFIAKSGYLGEMLAVARRPGKDPFVARCLTGQSAEVSLAPCERDIQIGDNLSLTYRFASHLLPEWRRLDAAVVAKASELLKTGH